MPMTAKINALGVERVGKDGEKIVGKGTLSVHGLGRFPVTLYANQWLELLSKHKEIEAIVRQALKDGTMSTKEAAPPSGGRVTL